MNLLGQIKTIIKKDITLELKSLESLAGMVLFLVATVYTVFLTFKKIPSSEIWNALFWIIIIFSAFNAITGSFKNETDGKQFYLYFLVNPKALILAKIIYNSVLMLVLTILGLLIFTLFLGSGVLQAMNIPSFLLGLVLTSLGLSGVLTIISAIAAQLDFKGGIITVLGLPLLFPLILISQKFSAQALSGVSVSGNMNFLLGLLTLNVAVVTLSYVLFPYLWRQ
ncbi:MAG: heme exporter protein CcmB [Flavobacteriales bacterium]